MKIYDISQEVFTSKVYPGDPAPRREVLMSTASGDVCNLTALYMCAHNGTHVDAPFHFIENGKTVDEIPLSSTVGKCYVAECSGKLTRDGAKVILRLASKADPESAKRILLKGPVEVSREAAEVFSKAGICLLGNESQTVGPEDAPAEVHNILLASDVVLLEGIRLDKVSKGVYLLSAAPLSLGGSDGAPCRAVLIEP